MTDPISFTSASPRLSLPYLFAGQAQKEVFVNEALTRLDALVHLVVEQETNSPPATLEPGQSWLVGSVPTGAWVGHAADIAWQQGGSWVFAKPVPGMKAFDKSTGQQILYDESWQRAVAVAAPSGGTTVDTQARAAIAGLIAALTTTGILA